jgi:transcription elongation factor Elf1
MTSQVSSEDIEAMLWQAGIKSRAIVARLMRAINAYALAEAHKYPQVEDLPPEPFSHLEPGESEMAEEVTKCLECSRPKRWSLFHVDRKSETGHKNICKACIGRLPVGDDGVTGKRLKYKCPGCPEKKPLAEFPLVKRDNPRASILCSSCEDKEREKRKHEQVA